MNPLAGSYPGRMDPVGEVLARLLTTHDIHFFEPFNWYGDNSSRSRFNLYAVFGADVKFSQFNLFGGYRLGLLDLDSRDNVALKYNGFFVGLGFTL